MIDPRYICEICKETFPSPEEVKGLHRSPQTENGKTVSVYIFKAPHLTDKHVCLLCLKSIGWLMRREGIKDMIADNAPQWGEPRP